MTTINPDEASRMREQAARIAYRPLNSAVPKNVDRAWEIAAEFPQSVTADSVRHAYWVVDQILALLPAGSDVMGGEDLEVSRNTGDHQCGSRDEAALVAAAPLTSLEDQLALIRQMAASSVKWDEENLAAIPAERAGEIGFSVGQYWRDRVKISRSWQAFCADPVNHPARKNLDLVGGEAVHSKDAGDGTPAGLQDGLSALASEGGA